MNNLLQPYSRSSVIVIMLLACISVNSQIFPNCPDSLVVETDIESCEAVIPDFSNLANLPAGYSFSQNPASGTVLSSMASWTQDITLVASNGTESEECSFLAILEPNAPSIPNNAWIAYCYNGKIILGQDVFRGYYHESELDVSSWQLWDIGVSPSWHSDYIGCNVTLDQHSVVYRRIGFPCGQYQLDILNHDNEVRLYVDENEVFAHNGFNLQHYDVFQGFLDENSKVEFEWNEGIGGSLGVLDLILQCPTDTMLYLDENCNAVMPDLRWTACAGGSVTQSINPGTPLDAGTYSFTMTTTDVTGWSENCTQNIHVIDTIAPIIDAPQELQEAYNSQCTLPLPNYLEEYSISDNCNLEEVSQTPLPGTIISTETTVTLSATDIHGNSTSHAMNVIPVDNQSPVISCPDDQIVDIGSSCSFDIPDYLSTITATDNCGTPSVVQTPSPGTEITSSGSYTISFAATDDAGLTSTCSFNLQVTDLTAPDLNCPENIYHHVDINCAYLMPDFSMAVTYQDNCPASLILTQEPPANTPLSTLDEVVVSFNLEDGEGNSASCSTTMHLIDTIAPVLNIEDTIIRNVDSECQYMLEDLTSLLGISESCDLSGVIQTPAPGEFFSLDQSPIHISFVVSDGSGNSASTTTEINLQDADSPNVTCPESIEIYADQACNYLIPDMLADVNAIDLCSGLASLVQSPSSAEVFFQSPPTNLEFLALDLSGNSATCLTQIHALDTISPVVSTLPPIELPLNEDCLIEVPDFTDDVIALDNCSDELQISQSPAAGELVVASSELECILTIADDSENETSISVQILFEDLTPPSIECPDSLMFEVNESCFWQALDLTDQVLVSDNCGSSLSIEQSFEVGQEIALSPNPNPLEFIVYDGAGNQSTCQTNIYLEDLIAPQLTVSENILELAIPGECGRIVEFDAPTSIDNCGESSIAQILGPPSGSFFEVGTTEITFQSIDQFGNSSTSSFLVQIEDEEAPVINCPADLQLYTTENECALWLEYEMPETSDNCGINSLTQTNGPASGSWVEPGNYVVTFIVSDIHGNEAECSFNVDIIDLIPPQVYCPENISTVNAEGLCGAFVSFDVTASDNCSDVVLEQIEGASSGSYFAVGTHQISYKATDSYGNETQCSFEVEVLDEEPPNIQCSWNINSTDPVVQYNLPISNDNCGVVSVELLSGLEPGSTFASGSNLVEYIATDPAMNFSTCEFEVYINTPPVAVPIIITTHLNYISLDPLGNDFDADGDPFFLESIDLPENARLEYDNTLSYFPDKTTCIGDSIPYSIRDVHGAIASSYIKIELLCPELVEAPEGFSPNNDGINDAFVIEGLEDFPGCQINIFNEQGVRVYFSSAYKNSWQGISNVGFMKGNDLPDGKYYFVLEIPQNSLKQTGFIILKR